MGKELNEIPAIMKKRAIWARGKILSDPESVHIDQDELLGWVYNEDDHLWYSIDGNYSSKSPEEKMEKRLQNKLKVEYYELEMQKRFKRIEYWSRIRNKILERDNNTCQLCGKTKASKLHIHHILKKKEGGPDTFDNLITVCPSCHRKADTKYYNPEWTLEGGNNES